MPRPTATKRQDDLLTPEEVAAELRIAKNTLYTWRHRGQGPAAFPVGGALRYRRSEIDRWLAASGDTAAQIGQR